MLPTHGGIAWRSQFDIGEFAPVKGSKNRRERKRGIEFDSVHSLPLTHLARERNKEEPFLLFLLTASFHAAVQCSGPAAAAAARRTPHAKQSTQLSEYSNSAAAASGIGGHHSIRIVKSQCRQQQQMFDSTAAAAGPSLSFIISLLWATRCTANKKSGG
jgi:hypothetical protein